MFVSSFQVYNFLGPVRGWLQRRLYPLAKRVVVLTTESASWMGAELNIQRVTVIPNSISLPLPSSEPILEPDSILSPDKKLIFAVGRLVDQKQHDVVLRAFAQTAQDPSWHLVVVGEGPNEQALTELAAELDIAHRFSLVPRIGNIQAWYERAEIYVSASAYEGFPNALLEAMACRCAVVAYDCPTGPGDIIKNGQDGLLVPLNDVTQFQSALSSLLQNADTRKSLADSATRVLDKYSDTLFFASWEETLTAAVNA